MKRELKAYGYRIQCRIEIIARLIPMKRELKDNRIGTIVPATVFIARLIPMKRELKGL